MQQRDKSEKVDKLANIRRTIIGILLTFLLCFAMLDALLFWFDPLGLVAYLHSFERMWETTAPSESGFTFIVGEHEMMGYSYTILEDRSRFVPATNPDATCTIVGIGDSLTFGMGVEDDETWVNLIASQYPNVHFINAGRPVFGAGNVYDSRDEYPADGYIWLVVSNDDFGDAGYTERSTEYLPASRLYWLYVLYPAIFKGSAFNVVNEYGVEPDPNTPSPSADVANLMLAEDNTLIFGFDEYPTNRIEEAILVPIYTDTVSPTDFHPSASAYRDIVDDIAPYIADFVTDICDT